MVHAWYMVQDQVMWYCGAALARAWKRGCGLDFVEGRRKGGVWVLVSIVHGLAADFGEDLRIWVRRSFGADFGEASEVTSPKLRRWVRRSFGASSAKLRRWVRRSIGADFGEASEVSSAKHRSWLRRSFGASSAKLRSALLGFHNFLTYSMSLELLVV